MISALQTHTYGIAAPVGAGSWMNYVGTNETFTGCGGCYGASHIVTVVGYGVDDYEQKYWWIRNSWGHTWGDGGYMRLLRGNDECCIEGGALAGPQNYFGLPRNAKHTLP